MAAQSRKRITGWGLSVIIMVLISGMVHSQGLTVTGSVKDSATGALISNVSVYFKNAHGVRTDSVGTYFLQSDDPVTYIEFSIVGYKKLRIPIKQDTGMLEINVQLHAVYNQLTTVVVTKK